MRRNLRIAHTLSSPPCDATVLLLAGAREAGMFTLPPGVDCLTVPSLCKSMEGDYGSRCLDLPFLDLIGLRAATLATALEAFDPDVLIVDNVPRGAAQELDPALHLLRRRGRARFVLGLRDVLDDPAAVRREWQLAANEETIARFYDAVWIYGDARLYDPVREYGFRPETAAKTRFVGYHDHRQHEPLPGESSAWLLHLLNGAERLALCLVGGGQDGGRLAEAFAAAWSPPGMCRVLVTGPYMPADVQARLRTLAAGRSDLRVVGFVTHPDALLQQADRVIAMGGYNTTYEILSYGRPALLVPRIEPRREQLIRAERLQALGLLDMLHPDGLSSAAISRWLARDLLPRPAAAACLDFNGAARLPELLARLLDPPDDFSVPTCQEHAPCALPMS